MVLGRPVLAEALRAGSIRPRPRKTVGAGARVNQLLNLPVLEINDGHLGPASQDT